MDDRATGIMQCPVCRIELRLADRQGIEIDYCPQCRGVWLDRGELDKLIDRSAAAFSSAPVRRDRERDYGDLYPRDRDGREYDDDDQYRPGRRRKSFLSDIFDLD